MTKWTELPLEDFAREDNFDEEAYLKANPDVLQAVQNKQCPSGQAHFLHFRKKKSGSSGYLHKTFN